MGNQPARDPSRASTAQLASIGLLSLLIVLVGAIGVVLTQGQPPPSPGSSQPIAAAPSASSPGAAVPSATPDVLTTPAVDASPGLPDPSASPPATPRPRRSQSPEPLPTATAPAPTATPAATSTPRPTLPTDPTLDAALARCPTAAELQFVDRRLDIVFFDDLTAPELVCRADEGSRDLTRLQRNAYQAVLAMRWIQFDAPLPWTDRPLFNWFVRAIGGIDFWSESEFSYCCNGDHVMIRSAPEMAHLTAEGWDNDDPEVGELVALVQLLVHEARHNEGYLHTCNWSDAAGGYADDQTIEELGAWGVQYWLSRWLAEHVDPAYMTPANAPADFYTNSARESAEFIAKHRICQPPAS